jgi:hypothetical protein
MVNIRATLNAAEAARVIRASTRMELERIAKGIFYQERSYPAILQHAAEKNSSRSELESLRRWLPTGQVDQKQEDAIAMLRLMRVQLEAGLAPKCTQYSFEYTANWEIARRRSGSLLADSLGGIDAILQDSLLDELRLEDGTYAQVKREALLRFLALRETWQQGMLPTHEMIRNELERFHRETGTEDQEAFECWLQQNHLNHEEFRAFIEDQARLEWAHKATALDAVSLITDHLRHTGRYARLAKRASDKQRALELAGIRYPSLADSRLTKDQLLEWYFQRHLGRPVPSDLARYCRAAGFVDENSFLRVILREYCYSEIL